MNTREDHDGDFHVPNSLFVCHAAVRRDDNMWRSVFLAGSNKAPLDQAGSGKWDKAEPSSPTVYDWYNKLD